MKNSLKKLICFFSPSYRRLGLLEARLLGLENSIKQTQRLMQTEADLEWHRIASLLDKHSGVTDQKRETALVVNLTTIPSRVHLVHLAIESIFQQSIKADQVILWLGEDKFREQGTPSHLESLKKRGLEIRYCEDVRSHTKLVHAVKQMPESIHVTADDDLIYPQKWLELLYDEHVLDGTSVICHRAHKMRLNKHGQVLPHSQWDYETDQTGPSFSFFPTGSGGVLYPPHSLSEKLHEKETFLKICPTEDDLWFKAMAMINGVKARRVNGELMTDDSMVLVRGSQVVALCHANVKDDGNYEQIKKVFEEFDLASLLKD